MNKNREVLRLQWFTLMHNGLVLCTREEFRTLRISTTEGRAGLAEESLRPPPLRRVNPRWVVNGVKNESAKGCGGRVRNSLVEEFDASSSFEAGLGRSLKLLSRSALESGDTQPDVVMRE